LKVLLKEEENNNIRWIKYNVFQNQIQKIFQYLDEYYLLKNKHKLPNLQQTSDIEYFKSTKSQSYFQSNIMNETNTKEYQNRNIIAKQLFDTKHYYDINYASKLEDLIVKHSL
jgi:hypothetical protein